MILQAFDNRNAAVLMDGLELKAIYLMLERANKEQFEQVAYAMGLDGFKLSPSDIAAYTRHFQLVMRDVVEKIVRSDHDDEDSAETELVN